MDQACWRLKTIYHQGHEVSRRSSVLQCLIPGGPFECALRSLLCDRPDTYFPCGDPDR